MDEIMNSTEMLLKEHLANSLGLEDYVWLIDHCHQDTFNIIKDKENDKDFKTVFNRFYHFRYNMKTIGKNFYAFFEDIRHKHKIVTFPDIINGLHERLNQRVEPSFSSKMLHTLYPEKPIWDKNVLSSLGYTKEWERERSINNAVRIYNLICDWYSEYLGSTGAKKAIEVFDLFLPKYKNLISSVKKIDYLLWIKGKSFGSKD